MTASNLIKEDKMDIIRNPNDELAIAAMVGANTSKAAIEYARKLGIAEAALVTISAYADIPGTDLAATLREISDIAHSALVKTERRKAGLTALQHHQKYMEDHTATPASPEPKSMTASKLIRSIFDVEDHE
jgi:pilus assembly protein TadC